MDPSQTQFSGPQVEVGQMLQNFAEVMAQMMQTMTQQSTATLTAMIEELRSALATRNEPPREAKVEGLSMPVYHGRPDESVEEFFFHARLFMEGKNIDYTAAQNQARLVAMLAVNLKDGAASWYHHRVIVDGDPVHTLLDFQGALEREFVPPDQQQRLRAALKQCRQTGGIEDYVARFRRLIAQVREMSQIDMIDRFVDGLKRGTQQEVNYLRCATLTAAIEAARAFERTHFNRSSGSSHTPTETNGYFGHELHRGYSGRVSP
ncbi:hypothetical protein PINS_up005966 [Pythium insidiosum]|nr:hypothetical protein PINS_up005966 [Pythium insidiosum]